MRPHTRTHCSRKGECEGETTACHRVPHTRARDGEQQHPRGREDERHLHHNSTSLVQLPAELLVKILEYLTFKEHASVRLVCRRMNEIAAGRLNSIFQLLQNRMLVRFQAIKSQMPRRESARRNHPLSRECDIVETLHMRLTLLQMTFGKHIERKHICFFPGEILDEVFRILRYIQCTLTPLGRTYKVTDELFDLSTMAMEYFKDNIEPSLPEITYFGADFLDFTPPFASPVKKLARTGGLDSPISSRSSAVGSSCSEPPISYSQFEGDGEEGDEREGVEAPPGNMVLRKRIKRIRAGMKKYNTQLDEVKRELKSCKSKMDNQTKQVAEYSSRLDEYDKKFEENSRKFGTLLTELNKCKTELQFYRSRAHMQQCQMCGSSLTDQASDSTNADQVTFPTMDVGVDKQAMVEDWLNPDTPPYNQNQPTFRSMSPAYRAPVEYKHCHRHQACIPAPPVQSMLDSNNIQKISKTEEDAYLRSGPGSPGYTRGGPRSPGGGGSPGSPGPPGPSSTAIGPSGVRKRRSRDEEEKKGWLRGQQPPKGSRLKRPKQQQQAALS